LGRAHAKHAGGANNADASSLHALAAATEFRRAGAHSILLSDRKAAVENFSLAGERYSDIGNPYGLFMFACAELSEANLTYSVEHVYKQGQPDRLHMVYLSLASAAAGWDKDFQPLLNELHGSLSSPIGVLGLQVGAYLDLAHALKTGDKGSILRGFMPFLMAHSNAMTRAMENRYHWRRMALPFHPAEPDILSVTFLVEAAARRRNQKFVAGILKDAPLLRHSADLLYNATLERFGDPH
jgi:hypothetical protein